MKKRLLCLGLVAAVSQLFGTGCLFHPVARWRANHPCGPCAEYRPRLHPIQTRRAILGEPVGPVGAPVCHGCAGGAPGVPVSFGGAPGDLVPVTHPPAGYPSISYPMPITPGPMVVPHYEAPSPMPAPKTGGN